MSWKSVNKTDKKIVGVNRLISENINVENSIKSEIVNSTYYTGDGILKSQYVIDSCNTDFNIASTKSLVEFLRNNTLASYGSDPCGHFFRTNTISNETTGNVIFPSEDYITDTEENKGWKIGAWNSKHSDIESGKGTLEIVSSVDISNDLTIGSNLIVNSISGDPIVNITGDLSVSKIYFNEADSCGENMLFLNNSIFNKNLTICNDLIITSISGEDKLNIHSDVDICDGILSVYDASLYNIGVLSGETIKVYGNIEVTGTYFNKEGALNNKDGSFNRISEFNDGSGITLLSDVSINTLLRVPNVSFTNIGSLTDIVNIHSDVSFSKGNLKVGDISIANIEALNDTIHINSDVSFLNNSNLKVRDISITNIEALNDVVYINSDVNISGNLIVEGSFEVIEKIKTISNEIIISKQLDICNNGTGHALTVTQTGSGSEYDVVLFNSLDGSALEIDSNGDALFYKNVNICGGYLNANDISINTIHGTSLTTISGSDLSNTLIIDGNLIVNGLIKNYPNPSVYNVSIFNNQDICSNSVATPSGWLNNVSLDLTRGDAFNSEGTVIKGKSILIHYIKTTGRIKNEFGENGFLWPTSEEKGHRWLLKRATSNQVNDLSWSNTLPYYQLNHTFNRVSEIEEDNFTFTETIDNDVSYNLWSCDFSGGGADTSGCKLTWNISVFQTTTNFFNSENLFTSIGAIQGITYENNDTTKIDNNVNITGNLSVDGSFNLSEIIKYNTIISNELLISKQVDISNHGTGPALTVTQYGDSTNDKLALFHTGENGEAFEISHDGKSLFYKDVEISSNLTINGDVSINTRLNVPDVSINTRLNVPDVSINNIGALNNNINFLTDVSFNKNVEIGNDLTVNGVMEIANNQNPQLLVTTANTGKDSILTIRGSRNNNLTKRVGQLTIENYDIDGDGIINKLVEIAGRVSDVSDNLGGMVISNSSNGRTSTGALTMSSNGNFLIGGNNFQDDYKLDVTGDANISSNLTVGGDISVNGVMKIVNDQTPQLLVTVSSESGYDSHLIIRGARNGSNTERQGQLTIENYDSNYNDNAGSTHKLVEIAGKVSNHTNNLGGMLISNYSDGITRTGAMSMSLNGNFLIGSGNDSFQNDYKLDVSGNVHMGGDLVIADYQRLITENARNAGGPNKILLNSNGYGLGIDTNTITYHSGGNNHVWYYNSTETADGSYTAMTLNKKSSTGLSNLTVTGYVNTLGGGPTDSLETNVAFHANALDTIYNSAKIVLRNDSGNLTGAEILGGLNSLTTSIATRGVEDLSGTEFFAINEITNEIGVGPVRTRILTFDRMQGAFIDTSLTVRDDINVNQTLDASSVNITNDLTVGSGTSPTLNGSLNSTASFITTGDDLYTYWSTGSEEKSIFLYFDTTDKADDTGSNNKGLILFEGLDNWSRQKIHFCLNNETNNDPDRFATVDDAVLTMVPSGRVGIGTQDPSCELHVIGSANISNITSDLTVEGSLYVGLEGGGSPGKIYLGGNSGDTQYNLSTIETRLYNGNDKSEMLLFQGNDLGNNAGPDRIRLFSGEILLCTNNVTTNNSTSNTGNTVMTITNYATVLIGDTNSTYTQGYGSGGLTDENDPIGINEIKNINLIVAATDVSFNFSKRAHFQYNGGSDTPNDVEALVSAFFEESIILQRRMFIFSDSRIKTNVNSIQDDRALIDFRKLNPCYYEYVDNQKGGIGEIYGFIAQEVNEVLPNSCSIGTNNVPNVFSYADISGNRLILESGTFENLELDLKDSSGNVYESVVIGLEKKTGSIINFTIKEIIDNSSIELSSNLLSLDISSELCVYNEDTGKHQVFVYGQLVNNFYRLDKNAIWTVAAAALQEVDRQQQSDKVRIAELETEVTTLKTEVSTLKTQMSDLLARVSSIETNLNS